MVLILQSVKAKSFVNGLTIGIGGLLISDAIDSFLKAPAKKVNFFTSTLKKVVLAVNANQNGMYITISKQDNAMSKNPKDHVQLANTLLIIQHRGPQNVAVSKTLCTIHTTAHALSSTLKANALKENWL